MLKNEKESSWCSIDQSPLWVLFMLYVFHLSLLSVVYGIHFVCCLSVYCVWLTSVYPYPSFCSVLVEQHRKHGTGKEWGFFFSQKFIIEIYKGRNYLTDPRWPRIALKTTNRCYQPIYTLFSPFVMGIYLLFSLTWLSTYLLLATNDYNIKHTILGRMRWRTHKLSLKVCLA